MASTQSIALTGGSLITGMRDFCCWHKEAIPYDGNLPHALLSIWGQGALELHAELTQYAQLVAEMEDQLWATIDDGFPGVWQYEVVEALGWSITEWIIVHDGSPPTREWVMTNLANFAATFFAHAPRSSWPALRNVLTQYTPTLLPNVLVS